MWWLPPSRLPGVDLADVGTVVESTWHLPVCERGFLMPSCEPEAAFLSSGCREQETSGLRVPLQKHQAVHPGLPVKCRHKART